MLSDMREHPGFADKISRLRIRRTQRSVALEIGIPPSVLSDYELGYRELPTEVLARLHRILQPNSEDDAPAVWRGDA
jgi:predicted transcriptional regulator